MMLAADTAAAGADLFAGFDADQVAAIEAGMVRHKQDQRQARAQRTASRVNVRRCKAEKHLAEILPVRIPAGDSWDVISHGDIDSLSFLRHALAGTTHFDHVLISTWCIARADLEEIRGWLDAGRIDQFDLYAGEIFPNQYGDEYELMQQLQATYGCGFKVARNHSKVTLAENATEGYRLAIRSSANVNTNPRIEQTTITCDDALHAFYLEFFNGIRSIDRG
jgi:hypothetical protein